MANLQEIINTDIAIIGGGIAGTSIARELSKYDISITFIEQRSDVGLERTTTNHALVSDLLSTMKDSLRSRRLHPFMGAIL